MSIEKVAAEHEQVLGLLDLASLVQALEAIDQAEGILAVATQGSQRPEAAQAVALLGHVKQQLAQVYQQVDQARQLIQQYLANVAGGRASAPTTPAPMMPPTKPTATDSASDKPKLTRGQADAIRATLPPQVPTPNPTGKKTHGKWFDASGVGVHIVSEYDQDAAEAWRLLQAAGMPPTREPSSTAHVEMKTAVRARKSGAKHTEVILNNVPCQGIYSCDQLLPILLPEGYSLTVHGPNYRKTFTGGKKWSN